MRENKMLRVSPSTYESRGKADSIIKYMRGLGAAIPEPINEVVGSTIYATVNHGRWLAECECKNAQFVDDDDRRFFCIKCFNVAVGGRWRPVEFPREIAQIEALLSVRSLENQNWSPGETLGMLEGENAARGL